jgi:hypothetical protein
LPKHLLLNEAKEIKPQAADDQPPEPEAPPEYADPWDMPDPESY